MIYRITYRSEVLIKAESEEQAKMYFEDLDLDNLAEEQQNENIVSSDFVEMDLCEKFND